MNLTCLPVLRGFLTPFVEKLTFDLTQLVLYFSLFGERREKNNQLLFLFPKPKKYKLSMDSCGNENLVFHLLRELLF